MRNLEILPFPFVRR